MNGLPLPTVVQKSTLENVEVARRVPLILTTQSVELNLSDEIKNKINLANPTFGKPGRVVILLGAIP